MKNEPTIKDNKTGASLPIGGTGFSPHLFWDVDQRNIDPVRHEKLLVQRVLEFGKWEDWVALQKLYGLEKIAAVATSLRNLEPKALHFIANMVHKPLSSFRCYFSKPSMPTHSRFYSD